MGNVLPFFDKRLTQLLERLWCIGRVPNAQVLHSIEVWAHRKTFYYINVVFPRKFSSNIDGMNASIIVHKNKIATHILRKATTRELCLCRLGHLNAQISTPFYAYSTLTHDRAIFKTIHLLYYGGIVPFSNTPTDELESSSQGRPRLIREEIYSEDANLRCLDSNLNLACLYSLLDGCFD